MKLLKWMLGAVVLLAVVYLIGPKAKFGVVDTEPVSFDIPLESLAAYIEDRESRDIQDIDPRGFGQFCQRRNSYSQTSRRKSDPHDMLYYIETAYRPMGKTNARTRNGGL